MAEHLKSFINLVDGITEKTCDIIKYLGQVMMLLVVIEVVCRYGFNSPTTWAGPINKQVFGIFILMADPYAMLHDRHLRVEIFYNHFSSRIKKISGIVALISFVLFLGVVIWQGGWMGWTSWKAGETITGVFRLPLYPYKILIPVSAILFLFQGIVAFLRPEESKKRTEEN